MSAVVRFLAGFCRDHPLDEKVLVCPSFVTGREIGEALARDAGSWVNLRFVTPSSLAAEVLRGRGAAGAAKPMTSSAELALTDRLFRELLAAGELEYFGRAGATPGLTQALHRAIRELRLDGRTSADVRPDCFLVERKGRELALLVARYERALETDGLLDLPALLDKAARAAAPAPAGSRWILCPTDARLSRREAELVRAAGAGRLVLVPGDPVVGLERPPQCWPCPAPADLSGPGRLSWLFAPRQAPAPNGAAPVEIFRALGPANECREILRRLYAEKIPFDQAEVLAPSGAAHATVFYLLSAKTGLPVTFGEGVPVSFTSPGRLFFGLAEWLRDDFSSDVLCRLIENGDLVLPAGAPGAALAARTACRHLRDAMIGWGRDRYVDRLRALCEAKEADLASLAAGEGGDAAEEAEGRRAGYGVAADEIRELSKAISRILALVPGQDAAGSYDLGGLCEAFSGLIERFGRADEDLDLKARHVLLDRLDEFVAESRFPPLPLKEALDLIRTAGASLRVGASPALPGRLHVSGLLSGGHSGRPVTFVAGLDEAAFPGRGLQDPVLLDEERAAIAASLPTSADVLRGRLYGLAAVLASLRGRVVLSYPSYDIVEGRESFPSSVVLQAYRLSRGDADLDYAALDRELPEASGFFPGGPGRALDETEWWLDRLRSEPLPDGRRSVAANFAELAAGLAAAEARTGDQLTAYEGIVDIGPLRADVDPVAGEKAVMSATRLELLAKCPFAYFLRHVLKVQPPEEVAFDRSRWLDPLQRGTLVHEILCEFMSEVRDQGDGVETARHAALAASIAGARIDLARRKIPPPSEAIFESERRDILETLDIFMAAEGRREVKGRPLAFEKAIDREVIALGGGRSFRLRGSIDRVDGLGRDTYRVLDYKTGNPSDYEELVEFGNGQKIQHALYAVALEQILARERPGAKPRVAESGYLFPSRRGEGLERIIRDFDRDRLRSLLNDLLRLVEAGYFIAGPDARCKYCDYAHVCVSGGPDWARNKKTVLLHLLEIIDAECAVAGIRSGGGDIDLSAACGGDASKTRERIQAGLRVFEAFDKLDEYK
jgi:ATP-dependent helicase/nuclease subunit B